MNSCPALLTSQKQDDKIIHENFGHDFMPHSTYFPNLMPSNFHLFATLKKKTRACLYSL
jgi:hypothetical protein